MPVPITKHELQHLFGFIAYLSRFVKAFSAKSAVLRDVLRQDSDFVWEARLQQAFLDLKKEVSDNSLLHYYDPRKPTYLQCDASMRGIGAALLQPDPDGQRRPIAYASKSLTSTVHRYALSSANSCRSNSECHDSIRTYMDGRSMSSLTTDPSWWLPTNPSHLLPQDSSGCWSSYMDTTSRWRTDQGWVSRRVVSACDLVNASYLPTTTTIYDLEIR